MTPPNATSLRFSGFQEMEAYMRRLLGEIVAAPGVTSIPTATPPEVINAFTTFESLFIYCRSVTTGRRYGLWTPRINEDPCRLIIATPHGQERTRSPETPYVTFQYEGADNPLVIRVSLPGCGTRVFSYDPDRRVSIVPLLMPSLLLRSGATLYGCQQESQVPPHQGPYIWITGERANSSAKLTPLNPLKWLESLEGHAVFEQLDALPLMLGTIHVPTTSGTQPKPLDQHGLSLVKDEDIQFPALEHLMQGLDRLPIGVGCFSSTQTRWTREQSAKLTGRAGRSLALQAASPRQCNFTGIVDFLTGKRVAILTGHAAPDESVDSPLPAETISDAQMDDWADNWMPTLPQGVYVVDSEGHVFGRPQPLRSPHEALSGEHRGQEVVLKDFQLIEVLRTNPTLFTEQGLKFVIFSGCRGSKTSLALMTHMPRLMGAVGYRRPVPEDLCLQLGRLMLCALDSDTTPFRDRETPDLKQAFVWSLQAMKAMASKLRNANKPEVAEADRIDAFVECTILFLRPVETSSS